MEKKKTCCFTGHTPKKLKGTEGYIKECLLKQISQSVGDGYDTFITGMARVVDLWAAEVVLDVKRNNPTIKLVAAVPTPNFKRKWEEEWQEKYNTVIKQVDETIYVSPEMNRVVFHKRDRLMVNHSSRVIAVFNGTCGGTKYTLDYAKQEGLDIVVIEDRRN